MAVKPQFDEDFFSFNNYYLSCKLAYINKNDAYSEMINDLILNLRNKKKKKVNFNKNLKLMIIRHVVNNNEKITEISQLMGINKRTIQKWCKPFKYIFYF